MAMSTGETQKFVVRDMRTGQQVGPAYESKEKAEGAKVASLKETAGATGPVLEVKELLQES
jgi:hypothetical protein